MKHHLFADCTKLFASKIQKRGVGRGHLTHLVCFLVKLIFENNFLHLTSLALTEHRLPLWLSRSNQCQMYHLLLSVVVSGDRQCCLPLYSLAVWNTQVQDNAIQLCGSKMFHLQLIHFAQKFRWGLLQWRWIHKLVAVLALFVHCVLFQSSRVSISVHLSCSRHGCWSADMHKQAVTKCWDE